MGESLSLEGVRGRMIDLTVELQNADGIMDGSRNSGNPNQEALDGYNEFRIELARNEEYTTVFTYDRKRQILEIDRTWSGVQRDVICTRKFQITDDRQNLKLRFILDRSSIELFINDGSKTATTVIPTPVEADEAATGSRRNPTVKDFLMSYRKEDLLSIAGELGLHCKGMDQEEIAAKVAAEVLKPEVMKASFLVADDQEVLAFEAAIQRKCFHVAEDEWNTLEWLNDMGYLVSYSDDYAEVPAEVVAVYDQINTPEFQTLRSQVNWLKDCLIMVSYLYVSAPAKTVYEMFKQRKGFDIGYDRFIELYHTIPEKACICELAEDQLILKSALVNNIYKDIERRQGGRKFYIPSVDEILDYSENGYPTKSASYQRLGRFLLDEIKVSDAVKDQVLFFIYKECSMDGRMSAIMENLNQKGIQFNDEQLEKFTKLIMEANNNTRMLEFRGYTPNEISGAVWPFATGKPHTAMPNSFVPTAMPMQPASARKIYPNDPCPCGSGKKYKKCCGRR